MLLFSLFSFLLNALTRLMKTLYEKRTLIITYTILKIKQYY